MPKVTVIIPNYNHARFLDQRIQSVLNQSYDDFEVLLLDDASTDDSLSIFNKYANHPRVREILRNETNTGIPFKQWNKGVAEARGEYIWIAESDDYASTKLLEVLVSLLDLHPNVGVAYCQSSGVDEDGKVVGSLKSWTDDLDKDHWDANYVNCGREECRRYVALKCTIPNASAVVFRRGVYEIVGNADEDFRLSGDWMIWAKLLMVSDVAFVAEPLNYFRMHGNTVRASSAKSAVALQEALRIFEYILDRIDVPEQVQQVALDGLLNRWIGAFSTLHLGLGAHFALYRTFRQIDQRFHQRALKRFATRIRKLLGTVCR